MTAHHAHSLAALAAPLAPSPPSPPAFAHGSAAAYAAAYGE
jgi:hypothetical protein